NLGLNNPGNQTGNVTVNLIDKDGQALGSLITTTPSQGVTQLNDIVRSLLGGSVVANREGWLKVESDQPVIAWTSQIDNATQDPSLLVGQGSGSGRLLIPSAVSSGSYTSTLVVVNLDAQPIDVQLIARDSDGNLRGSQSVTIAGLGQLSVADILAN